MRLIRVLMLMGVLPCCLGVFPGRLGTPYTGPTVKCQVWRNVGGDEITDTLETTDLQRSCDQTRSIDQMEFAPDFKEPWACSMTAYITPPRTGAYWFHIAARDSGLLYLSTDESAEHLQYMAETPSATDLHTYKWYSAQLSNGIRLEAGHKYLMQAICKSGPGPGGISIAWTTPGGIFQGPIPRDRFSEANQNVPLPNYKVDQLRVSLRPDPAPAIQPGIHTFERGAQILMQGRSIDFSYAAFFPKQFGDQSKTVPMLVFLHGNNCQGYNLLGAMSNGPLRSMKRLPQLMDWMPMVVLHPQLPPDWRWDTPGAAQAVNALVQQLCGRYPRIDRRRIYLTGLSMGGKGTWLTAEHSPKIYAAVIPISAVDVRPDLAPQLFADLPELHIVCGSEDHGFTAGSHRMYDALRSALGDRVQLTVYEHEGHGVWNHLYNDQKFYESLMKFSR